jgi:hypothetical protein
MNKDNLVTEALGVEGAWIDEISSSLPEHVHHCAFSGTLPPEILHLKIGVGIRKWPEGHERHIKVQLGDSLLRLMREGAAKLDEPLLPPGAHTKPLDALRFLKPHGDWSDAIEDLSEPLWRALVQGVSRHFGIEYKLVVQINTQWGIAPSEHATPKQLLTAFGFNPAEFSLYHANSAEPLPPDTPLHLKRGERFEAQKDGRYGSPALVGLSALRAIEREVESGAHANLSLRLLVEGSQEYVEVSDLDVPNPPWNEGRARILIAVPATYPNGGLDAFYVDRATVSHQSGTIPYEQSRASIAGKEWGLISWHYTVNRPWNPARDNLASHIAHCRGYFLRRGVTQ